MKFGEFVQKIIALNPSCYIKDNELYIPLGSIYTFYFDAETFFVKFMNCNGFWVEFGKEETKVVFSEGKGVDKKLEWDTLGCGIVVGYDGNCLVVTDLQTFSSRG